MLKMNRIVVSISLATGIALNCALTANVSAQRPTTEAFGKYDFCRSLLGGETFARTELFFGLSRSNGPNVTEEEFQGFIDTVVTPLFPDGLTLLTGSGQFNSNGQVVKEGTKLLILLYPFNRESNRNVEQIRQEYINAFQQQSVLRTDEQSCVAF